MPLQRLPANWRQTEAYTVLLALLTISLAAGLLSRLYQTSQRRVDAAERRYAAIVQSSRDAIISKTTDGIVTSWNPAAQQMFGYSAEEMIGQPLLRLLPPERLGEEDDILARIRRNEVVDSFETVRLHKDGSRFDVSVTISPVLDATGHITGASKIARDISRQKAAEEAIRRLAYHDTLTGLPNRRLLLDRLDHAVTLSQRSQNHAALLFIDLDRFKQLNDTHGHEAGDALLIAVAERLQDLVRESDTVARYGGDEFIVLCENLGPLPETAAEHARTTADKIGTALGTEFQLGTLTHQGGASVGVHLFLGDGQNIDDLLKAADAAMYRTKMEHRANRQTETSDGR
jgi:diguanylate cyclase (GGDEF)-like protein/PAS domain S-box-containing protein